MPKHWGLALDSGQCRLCGSSELQRFFWMELYAGSGQQLRRCGHCAAVYLAPGFTEAGLTEFYGQRYRQMFPAEVPWRNKTRFFAWRGDRETARERLSLITKKLAQGAQLFEMGSGFGAFLGQAAALRDDLRLSASEPDRSNRTALLEQARVHFVDDLEQLIPGSLDGLVAFHVLEHLIDPRTFLVQTANALNTDGQLWIEVPDLMANWNTRLFVHPAHLSYFCADSLRRLVEATGLQVTYCGPHPMASLPGNLWLEARRGEYLAEQPLQAAESATVKAIDQWIERVHWTASDRVKAVLKRFICGVLGPGVVGELQRWRQHRARTTLKPPP